MSPDLEPGCTYRVTVNGLCEFVGIYLGLNEVGLPHFKYRLDVDAEGRNTITQMRPDEITSALRTEDALRAPGLIEAVLS